MRIGFYILTFLIIVFAAASAAACDWKTGERKQHVFLSWNGEGLEDWEAPMGHIQQVTLPNGFELGIELDELPHQKHMQLAEKLQHVPEVVQINLFDLAAGESELLSETFGETNSIQGFGARGEANTVEKLGDPGINLTLLKPVCAEPTVVPVAR